MRKALKVIGLVGMALVAAGLVLPGRSEVVREAHLDATPGEVLAAVGALESSPRWCTWKPARSGALRRTSLTEGGAWFEVDGRRRRLAAVLVQPDGSGSRVTWSDVEHYGLDPLARWAALLLRERLVGPQLEESLESLPGELSDDG